MYQAFAEKFLQEVITFKSKDIDGPYTGNAYIFEYANACH